MLVMNVAGLLGLAVLASPLGQSAAALVIDLDPVSVGKGRVFDGVGGLSGGTYVHSATLHA